MKESVARLSKGSEFTRKSFKSLPQNLKDKENPSISLN